MRWGRLVNSIGAFAAILGFCVGIPLAFAVSATATNSDQGLLAIVLTVIGTPLLFFLPFVLIGTMLRILGKSAYNAAKAKWWQLYYCHRCGSVFNPNNPGKYTSVGGMKALL